MLSINNFWFDHLPHWDCLLTFISYFFEYKWALSLLLHLLLGLLLIDRFGLCMFHQISELTSWVCLLIISIGFGLCLRCHCHDYFYSLYYLLFLYEIRVSLFSSSRLLCQIYWFNSIIFKFYIPCIWVNPCMFSSSFNYVTVFQLLSLSHLNCIILSFHRELVDSCVLVVVMGCGLL